MDDKQVKNLENVGKIFQWAKHLKWGGHTLIRCPWCGKDMIISRSDYNGHVHARCQSCKSGVMQ